MGLLARLLRIGKRCAGRFDCPLCGRQSVKWVKDVLLHPEEPPILGHWQCANPDCLARTDIMSAPWADSIARDMGYPTYMDALKDKVAAAKERERNAQQD